MKGFGVLCMGGHKRRQDGCCPGSQDALGAGVCPTLRVGMHWGTGLGCRIGMGMHRGAELMGMHWGVGCNGIGMHQCAGWDKLGCRVGINWGAGLGLECIWVRIQD